MLGLGGLGHMAVKLACAIGAEVTVFSHSEHKRDDALKLGAHYFVNTKNFPETQPFRNYFNLMINTISRQTQFDDYLNLLALDGCMTILGVPEKPATFSAFSLIAKCHSIKGSLIGGIKETQKMLDFYEQYQIGAEVEIIRPNQINEAFERMLKSDVRYRFVIDTHAF